MIFILFKQRCSNQNVTKISHNGSYHPGSWLNIKMTSHQYRKSHCCDKTILQPSYLHNGISYTGKTTSLYWIRALMAIIETAILLLYPDSMGQHGAHLGPTGPRWAPCWAHELCYPVALFLGQVTASSFQGYPPVYFSSNELQGRDYMMRYRDDNPSNGHRIIRPLYHIFWMIVHDTQSIFYQNSLFWQTS